MTAQDDHFQVHPLVEGCQLELRAIRLGKPEAPYIQFFHLDNFQSELALQNNFLHRARQLNRMGYTCYTPLNPVRGGYVPDVGKGTKADAIAKYTTMMVDVDRTNKLGKKNPATDDELARAECLADAISVYLEEMDFGLPRKVMSGNGYHLYYPIDLPNDEATSALIESTLDTLAEKFNAEDFEVDTVVFDAARITKVIGTLAIKGEASEDRPYREVVLCQ
jgi:hypothetical protein